MSARSSLAPNDPGVLMRSGRFFVTMGRTDAGLANIRRAIAMDQLNPEGYALLSFALSDAQQISRGNRGDQPRPADRCRRADHQECSWLERSLLGET